MSCGLPLPGRRLAAGAFSAVAAVLGVGSKVADQAATLLRGEGDAPAPSEPTPWAEPDAATEAWDAGSGAGDTPWPDHVGVVDGRTETGIDDETETGIDDEAEPEIDDGFSVADPEPLTAAEVTRVREPDTHAAELAARPAAEVIAAVDRLSTDELGALYDEESRGKRRKTVLAAIEAALTP